MSSCESPPRGRWAPTPSGLLHVGSARTALAAWLSVRQRGGSFVWRIEDLDPPRVVPGTAAAALRDLDWLGLDWDEGPDVGGPHAPYEQSRRSGLYEEALAHLAAHGRLFPCRLSRKDLRELATAPHGPLPGQGAPAAAPYPLRARPQQLAANWYQEWQQGDPTDASLRFRVDGGPVVFDDLVVGRVEQQVDREVGDFVLKRRDGLYAYQLAVVVDDLVMGVDEVVRGADLLDSTGRQLQLLRALRGFTPSWQRRQTAAAEPVYAHLPLVLGSEHEKLSKRDRSLTLEALRLAGVRPEQLVGWLGHSLGLLERPEACSARDLVPSFSWQAVAARARDETVTRLPEDLAGRLRCL